jgi:hypothetical protein
MAKAMGRSSLRVPKRPNRRRPTARTDSLQLGEVEDAKERLLIFLKNQRIDKVNILK